MEVMLGLISLIVIAAVLFIPRKKSDTERALEKSIPCDIHTYEDPYKYDFYSPDENSDLYIKHREKIELQNNETEAKYT